MTFQARKPSSRSTIASRFAVWGPAALSALTLGCVGWGSAQATPSLGIYSSAQVWGYVNTQYSSPLLGDVSFTINGPSDYASSSDGTPTAVAHVSYAIAPGLGGTDPVYDLVTTQGQYGFGYSGQAQVDGLRLRTQFAASTVDVNGQTVPSAANSSVYGYSYANWSQQMFIDATASRAAGSYGAILVGITLDGQFNPTGNPVTAGYGYSQLGVQTNFTDASGGNFQNSYYLYANAGDPSWSGSITLYKKVLFQFGTPFTLQLYQYASASSNGETDFFHTGRVSYIEVPFGATLESGAQQAGAGTLEDLYGTVVASSTPDDPNTNWDFGNGGGGFTPPVPELPRPALLLAGLASVAWLSRRRRG
jgi:hypothetical protein